MPPPVMIGFDNIGLRLLFLMDGKSRLELEIELEFDEFKSEDPAAGGPPDPTSNIPYATPAQRPFDNANGNNNGEML